MQKKAEAVSQGIAEAGATLTGVAWVWNWLGTNHDQITAICAIVGALGVIGGAIVNAVAKHRQNKQTG